MTCRDVIEFLTEYLAGNLSEADQALFERHLAVCDPCVAYLKSYQQTVQLVQESAADDPLPSEPVPEELVQAILKLRDKPAKG